MDAATPVADFVLDAIATTAALKRTAIAIDTSLTDLGFDSVNRVAVINQAEALYNVEFSVEQLLAAFEIDRVAELVQLIESVIRRA
jgi:acyl carrier protein